MFLRNAVFKHRHRYKSLGLTLVLVHDIRVRVVADDQEGLQVDSGVLCSFAVSCGRGYLHGKVTLGPFEKLSDRFSQVCV